MRHWGNFVFTARIHVFFFVFALCAVVEDSCIADYLDASVVNNAGFSTNPVDDSNTYGLWSMRRLSEEKETRPPVNRAVNVIRRINKYGKNWISSVKRFVKTKLGVGSRKSTRRSWTKRKRPTTPVPSWIMDVLEDRGVFLKEGEWRNVTTTTVDPLDLYYNRTRVYPPRRKATRTKYKRRRKKRRRLLKKNRRRRNLQAMKKLHEEMKVEDDSKPTFEPTVKLKVAKVKAKKRKNEKLHEEMKVNDDSNPTFEPTVKLKVAKVKAKNRNNEKLHEEMTINDNSRPTFETTVKLKVAKVKVKAKKRKVEKLDEEMKVNDNSKPIFEPTVKLKVAKVKVKAKKRKVEKLHEEMKVNDDSKPILERTVKLKVTKVKVEAMKRESEGQESETSEYFESKQETVKVSHDEESENDVKPKNRQRNKKKELEVTTSLAYFLQNQNSEGELYDFPS